MIFVSKDLHQIIRNSVVRIIREAPGAGLIRCDFFTPLRPVIEDRPTKRFFIKIYVDLGQQVLIKNLVVFKVGLIDYKVES